MSLATLLSRISPISLPSHYTTFIPGKTPFSTYTSVSSALVLYFVAIFGTQHVLKDQKPLKLNTLFRLHNILLSAGSGILLALTLEEIIPIVWKRGFFAAICDEASYTPRLEAYYVVNYLFKYIELFDTVFLALKKKELKFLHVFHHSATAALCAVQLQGRTSLSWVVMSLNLLVHVVMYYYYYASAGGAKIWWKKYLTSMQITQFVIDLAIVYTCVYTELAYQYAPSLPHLGHCASTPAAAVSGTLLLTSYLFLFINFYLQTYKPVAAPTSQPAGARKSKERVARTHKRAASSTSIAARLPSSH